MQNNPKQSTELWGKKVWCGKKQVLSTDVFLVSPDLSTDGVWERNGLK
jgi:hypothetical protein